MDRWCPTTAGCSLFPNGNRYGTDKTSKHNLRDAMHVAMAIRYKYDESGSCQHLKWRISRHDA